MSGIRGLTARLDKLEKQVQATPTKLAPGIIWTQTGGRTRCDEAGNELGALNYEEALRTKHCTVLVPEWCDLELPGGGYTSRRWWLPSESNGGDKLLLCQYCGSIDFLSILYGARPFFLGPHPDNFRLIPDWYSWKEENRVCHRLGGFVLPDYWMDFLAWLVEQAEDPETVMPLYSAWKEAEDKLIDKHKTARRNNTDDDLKRLVAERDSREWAKRRILDPTADKAVVKEGSVIPVVDRYIQDGKLVQRNRLILGNGSGGGLRAADPQVLKDLADLDDEIKDLGRRITELRQSLRND